MGAKHTASFFQAKEVNPMRCNLCPRQCGALRTETAGEGRCRMPGVPVVALDDPAGAAQVILRYMRGRRP